MDQGIFAGVDLYNRGIGANEERVWQMEGPECCECPNWAPWTSSELCGIAFCENLGSSDKNYSTELGGGEDCLNFCRDSTAQSKGDKAFNKHLLSLARALLLLFCSISTSYFLEGVASLPLLIWKGWMELSLEGTWPLQPHQSSWVREEHVTHISRWDSVLGLLGKTFLSTLFTI